MTGPEPEGTGAAGPAEQAQHSGPAEQPDRTGRAAPTDPHPRERREPREPREDPATVRAAGTVLWRRSPYGAGIEIALIHRPRYDDWSLPKGKLKRGEATDAAALRETREETGWECVLGAPLPTTWYLVEGRPKEVRYWAAEAAGGAFAVNDEVDRMAWLPPATARHRLSYDRDRPLVDALLRTLAG